MKKKIKTKTKVFIAFAIIAFTLKILRALHRHGIIG